MYIIIVHIILSQHDDFTIGALTSLRNYIIRFLSNMLNIELAQVLREMGISTVPVFCYLFNLQIVIILVEHKRWCPYEMLAKSLNY